MVGLKNEIPYAVKEELILSKRTAQTLSAQKEAFPKYSVPKEMPCAEGKLLRKE